MDFLDYFFITKVKYDNIKIYWVYVEYKKNTHNPLANLDNYVYNDYHGTNCLKNNIF